MRNVHAEEDDEKSCPSYSRGMLGAEWEPSCWHRGSGMCLKVGKGSEDIVCGSGESHLRFAERCKQPVLTTARLEFTFQTNIRFQTPLTIC